VGFENVPEVCRRLISYFPWRDSFPLRTPKRNCHRRTAYLCDEVSPVHHRRTAQAIPSGSPPASIFPATSIVFKSITTT
jgi:hypothetical protein